MEIKANAKINLCLDVVRRMENGYHEMDMIMVPIALHDTLYITKSEVDELLCENASMLMDENNTIIRARNLMREVFSIKQCFRIEVIKRIPMEAGMAGGSADAAATMKGIWKLMELSCSLEELADLGKRIGADVPFCIINACSLVQGIGEKVTRFTSACKFHVLLVKPAQGVSTGKAFQTLDFTCCEHPDTGACKQALEQGDRASFYRYSGNTLEQSAFRMVPEIQKIKERLLKLGFDFVLMSGSGSTVFAISEDNNIMERGYAEMKRDYPFVEKTTTL